MIRRAKLAGLAAAGDILTGSIVDTGLGITVDCANWPSWVLNSACWARSPEAWREMRQFAEQAKTMPAPQPPAAVPLATSGQPAYAGDATDQAIQFDRETTDVLRQAHDASAYDLSLWAGTQPEVREQPDILGNWQVWAIAGAAAFALFMLAKR